jgi:uncharacterized protein (DUF427 family)
MANAMEEYMRSQLGELRWVPAHRRVRAMVGGETVIDSRDARLVWEPFRVVGSYAVPLADVHPAVIDPVAVGPVEQRPPVLTPENAFVLHTTPGTAYTIPASARSLVGAGFTPDDPDLAGYVILDWQAFDEWREEEQVVLAHPHDPFQRVDCIASSAHVVVKVGDVVLADSIRPTLLLETKLPARYYLPRVDVRMELLAPSDTRTTCAYKGHASYWSAVVGEQRIEDVAWTYTDPLNDGVPVRDLICFYDDRVQVEVDGTPVRSVWF